MGYSNNLDVALSLLLLGKPTEARYSNETIDRKLYNFNALRLRKFRLNTISIFYLIAVFKRCKFFKGRAHENFTE